MRESRTYGSGRGACDETHVPTATARPGPPMTLGNMCGYESVRPSAVRYLDPGSECENPVKLTAPHGNKWEHFMGLWVDIAAAVIAVSAAALWFLSSPRKTSNWSPSDEQQREGRSS